MLIIYSSTKPLSDIRSNMNGALTNEIPRRNMRFLYKKQYHRTLRLKNRREVSIKYRSGVDNEWLDAGRDSRIYLKRPNPQERTGTWEIPFPPPVQQTTDRIGNRVF